MEIERIRPVYDFIKTPGETGYTLLCDSQNTKLLVFLDSTGNYIGRKSLFFADYDAFNTTFIIDNLENFKFLSYLNQWDTIGVIRIFSKKGELIKYLPMVNEGRSIFYKTSNDYVILGKQNCIVDSYFNIKYTRNSIKCIDSVGIIDFSMSKDGGFYGVGQFYGDAYNRWTNDRYDFYFYKTDSNFNMPSKASFSRTGINNLSIKPESPITIYPNPANNELTINAGKEQGWYTLSNITGQILLKGNEEKMNTSNLSNGIYFITFLDADQHKMCTKKLVIQHE